MELSSLEWVRSVYMVRPTTLTAGHKLGAVENPPPHCGRRLASFRSDRQRLFRCSRNFRCNGQGGLWGCASSKEMEYSMLSHFPKLHTVAARIMWAGCRNPEDTCPFGSFLSRASLVAMARGCHGNFEGLGGQCLACLIMEPWSRWTVLQKAALH